MPAGSSGAAAPRLRGPWRGGRRPADGGGLGSSSLGVSFLAAFRDLTLCRSSRSGYPHRDCIAASNAARPECSHRADTAASPTLGTIAPAGVSDQEGRNRMSAKPNIVLVHGAWADGSCWSDVIATLQAGGYHVTAPQFPMSSLNADVARLRQVLDFQDGPTVVAGHSYGGQIITALGADTANAVALVYIAAFG